MIRHLLRPSAGAAVLVAALAATAAPHRLAARQGPAAPLTRPERTGYRETSSYQDVLAFLDALPRSRRLHRTTMGYSAEGRALPLVVVGNVSDASPEAVRRSGLTRVYIQANIHAGEVEGKEAALELLRMLAVGRPSRWLDSLVLLVAPIYNADGNERVALTNRPLQHGPVGGMGQRPNAQGLDLNRDHMKLESPEARAQALLFRRYDPHVALDLHTTNGTVHAYHLTYAEPLHPATDRGIVDLLRGEWLPSVTRRVRERDGWELFFYGNVPGAAGGAERGWYSFDHRPRFGSNYWGLRNRVGVLSEAYAYATFEERIRATRRFVEECLDQAWARAGAIRALTAAADAGVIVGESLAVRARPRRGPDIEVLLGEVSEETHPYTGQRMLLRRDARRSERMADYTTFEGTEFARVPAAYFVPAGLRSVIERLEAHGVALARLETDRIAAVERFRVDSTWTAPREFQGHRERTVRGAWESATDTLPAGTVVVRVDQPLGRLVFLLLEPRADDGLLNWNLFDPAIETARYYPVRRGPRVP